MFNKAFIICQQDSYESLGKNYLILSKDIYLDVFENPIYLLQQAS